ncbi:MAG: hypothetical protein AAFW69_11570, partial [Pseudomonadota bacterium]
TEAICMAAAEATFREFGNLYGIRGIRRGAWAVHGDRLERGPHDAAITCGYGTGQSARATLIIYTAQRAVAGVLARRLIERFDAQNAALAEVWLRERAAGSR